MDTTITTASSGSLRQRMLQDVKIRGLGAHTQKDYIRHVRSLSPFWAVLPIQPAQRTSGDFNLISIDALWGRRPSAS